MLRNQLPKTSRIGLIAVALTGGMTIASSAFAVQALPSGYQLAAAEKASEGKCGEGKCGAAEAGSKKVSKAVETGAEVTVARADKSFVEHAPL